MAARASRAAYATKDDVTASIDSIGKLFESKLSGLASVVDVKLDSVLDRVAGLTIAVASNAATAASMAAASIAAADKIKIELDAKDVRVDQAHAALGGRVTSLESYKWRIVGGLAVLGGLVEFVLHFIVKK
jgi:hypothetical protein